MIIFQIEKYNYKNLQNKKKFRENCCINLDVFQNFIYGDPDFAVPILKSIFDPEHEILSLYSISKKKTEDIKFKNLQFMSFLKN